MAKKNKVRKPEVEKESEYYRLHTDAAKRLAEADESNSPEVSEEELRKYTSRSKIHISDRAKMLFVKWWFPASVCFFFIWGLSAYLADIWDTLLVTGIALGIVTDLLTNNVLRFFAKTKGENDRLMMVPSNGYSSFVLNILYAFLVLFFVYMLYNMINAGAAMITGRGDQVVLGVEPILFGLFYLGFDLMFIKYKHWITDMFRKRKRRTGEVKV